MSAGAVPMALTGKLRNPGGLWRETTHPAYAHVVSRWRERDPERLAATTLLDGAAELLYAGCEYYTSVQRVIPDAATSEILFTRAYEAVRRPGDPPATTFLLGGDSEPIRAEKSLFDLARWVLDRPQLCEVVGSADLDELVGGPAPTDVAEAVWSQWLRRLRAHLDRFGHAVYNLDFASPVAADTLPRCSRRCATTSTRSRVPSTLERGNTASAPSGRRRARHCWGGSTRRAAE